MRLRASFTLLVAAVSVAAAGCGGSSSSKPQIVTFKGPSVVSCVKKGQSKTVSFLYKTTNATAVEPEIDGQPPGAQAGFNPKGGHMLFAYICPGPHKLTITASGKNRKSVSKSVTVVPSSGG
jgi:hypothetical protein